MKKNYILLFFLLCFCSASSAQKLQELSVLSFEEKPFDTSARDERYKIIDGNGELFSIIKLQSNNQDDNLNAYEFDFGLCESRIKTVNGEVWIYVQRNAMYVTIKREGYKVLKHELNTTVQSGRVYEMTLSNKPVALKQCMVRFDVSPSTAKAMIMYKGISDGEEKVFGYTDESGSVARSLELGTYSYRVVSEMYHISDGLLNIDAKENFVMEKVKLRPNFSTVTLKAGDGVDIYINEEKKGRGEWSGALKAGGHRIATKKRSHSKVYLDVSIFAGKDTVIQLPEPTPMVGTLAIVSTPLDAKIFIDGKDYGLTPQNIDSLLIGNHTVELFKDGYCNELREIEIVEDEVTECNVALSKGASDKVAATVTQNTATSVKTSPVKYNRDGSVRSSRSKTISGIVIDRKGNPLEGAIVHATGGRTRTSVNADGTFALEVPEFLKSITVEQEGFFPKKRKVRNDEMLFRMNKDYGWFINFIPFTSLDLTPMWLHGGTGHGFGLMFGQMKNWGWYAKALIMPSDYFGSSATAGITKRLGRFLHLYTGIGYASTEEYYEYYEYYYNGYYHENRLREGYDYRDSFMLDLGLLIKPTQRFNINVGCSGYTDFNIFGLQLNVGVGVSF